MFEEFRNSGSNLAFTEASPTAINTTFNVDIKSLLKQQKELTSLGYGDNLFLTSLHTPSGKGKTEVVNTPIRTMVHSPILSS